MWRDTSGRTLADYPQPSVAVDVVLLTVLDDALRVVVHRRAGGHAAGRLALPGTFVHLEETLADAALRALRDVLGVTGRRPEQLGVFDALDRDERGRVLAVAHLDVVPPAVLEAALTRGPAHLVPAERSAARAAAIPAPTTAAAPPTVEAPTVEAATVEAPIVEALAFDHDAMVAAAVRRLRAEYAERPDPRGLLGPPFTMAELQRLHEAVAGGPVVKDTFRRGVLAHLEATDGHRAGTVGKPARLFRHRG